MVSFENIDNTDKLTLEQEPEPNFGPEVVSKKYTFTSPDGYDDSNDFIPGETTVKSTGGTKTGKTISLQGIDMSIAVFEELQSRSLAGAPQIYRNSLNSQVYQVFIDIQQIPLSGIGDTINYNLTLTIIQEGE